MEMFLTIKLCTYAKVWYAIKPTKPTNLDIQEHYGFKTNTRFRFF